MPDLGAGRNSRLRASGSRFAQNEKNCGAYAPQLDYRNTEEAIFWESGLCFSETGPQPPSSRRPLRPASSLHFCRQGI